MIVYSLPATVALVFKLVLLGYAIRSRVKNENTRLFLLLLVALSLFNFSEVFLLNYYPLFGIDRILQASGYAYFVTVIFAISILLHLSLRFAQQEKRVLLLRYVLLHIPSIALIFLILFTDSVVAGFQPFKFTIIRVPGPQYFLFETFLVVYLAAALTNLAVAATGRGGMLPIARLRNRLWLAGLAPMALLMIYLIFSRHMQWPQISSQVSIPVAQTFFLLVATYATHQYRLFDIEFFLPWSKVRKRKTVFYQRIQATVAELADLRTVDEALGRVSDILRCPTALVGRSHPVLALAGDGSFEMAQFPAGPLNRVDHIVVANEIAEAMPELHRFMQQFHVAAIVPFYPRSETAASWLLLGDSFSDSVYTPLDFKNVERLFDSLGEFFLDKLAYLRTELGHAEQHARDADERLQRLERELTSLREEQDRLHDSRLRLVRENRNLQQALDPTTAPQAPALKTVALISETPLEGQLAEFERQLIREALAISNADALATARLLGIDPAVLYDKMNRYGLNSRSGTDK